MFFRQFLIKILILMVAALYFSSLRAMNSSVQLIRGIRVCKVGGVKNTASSQTDQVEVSRVEKIELVIDQKDVRSKSAVVKEEKSDPVEDAAVWGNARACLQMGIRYEHKATSCASQDVESNKEMAFRYYAKAAMCKENKCSGCLNRAVDIVASYVHLGRCYEEGYGCGKDAMRAVLWYEAAVKNDVVDGCINLARCLIDGVGGVVVDYKTAYSLLEKASDECGSVEALAFLSYCYGTGIGIDKSDPEAMSQAKAKAKKLLHEAIERKGKDFVRVFITGLKQKKVGCVST